MERNRDDSFLLMFLMGVPIVFVYRAWTSLTILEKVFFGTLGVSITLVSAAVLYSIFSKSSRERRKQIEKLKDLPKSLVNSSDQSIFLGQEKDLKVPIYLPDGIRSRHVHILGATGSGKTESVIMNFLRQDVKRGLGAIILDAKGDYSFLESLMKFAPKDKLKVFDLGDKDSMGYDPLKDGSPLESAQRLFASLTWSEEYYKSKSLSALQAIYGKHWENHSKNPTLRDLAKYLENEVTYAKTRANRGDKIAEKLYAKEYSEILGLRDQINSLCIDYLGKTLSPLSGSFIDLRAAKNGEVIYFRLQSLMSPDLVKMVGRLVINNLNYLTGLSHREGTPKQKPPLIPTYLDEFASFACPEFADLISKARSANLALHFSHQSIGDLTEVSPGFLNRITDNSATKIVMRINDPDSAEYMARTFGTEKYTKITQRVTNSKDSDLAKNVGEGSVREAHQYRAPPDLLKTLPTGHGAVLIAHGLNSKASSSNVFDLSFPCELNERV